MTEVLSQRGLNRATLARQHLLERAPARAIDAIGHLGGMQSQAPLAPYVGLWTRLQDFAPDELSALTDQRQVVRLHLMRNTVHLVSARDCLDWCALFQPLRAAQFSAHFRHGTEGVDRDALLRQARAWAPVESWLGAPLRSVPVDALVLRYFGAFGPARIADIQMWSGAAHSQLSGTAVGGAGTSAAVQFDAVPKAEPSPAASWLRLSARADVNTPQTRPMKVPGEGGPTATPFPAVPERLICTVSSTHGPRRS